MADQPAQPSLPPPLLLMQLLFGKQITYAFSGVARLGIADHMSGSLSRSRRLRQRRERTHPRSTA